MTASTSMPSTSNAAGSGCWSSSNFAWEEQSGCSCAGQVEPGSRACCASSRGSTDPRKGTMTRLGNQVPPDGALQARLDGRVALLGQNPEHHFIASTAAEDIAWGLLRRGVEADEARRRSREMAMALRIDHLLERPCHQLSFGEQRRVALAGLLVLEPALLLLDEPTAGLDPVAAHELRTLVEESVRRTGAACVWATHDLHSMPSQATRVVLLRDRRLLFDGSRAEGLSKPWLIRAGLAVRHITHPGATRWTRLKRYP